MSVETYVSTLKKFGIQGASLTEHGNMSSALRFWHECKKNDINPILGIEAYVNDNRTVDTGDGENIERKKDRHIVLLAKNHAGFKDLVHISGEAFMEGFYYRPRTYNKLILERAGNIIVTTACLGSSFMEFKETDRLMNEYKEAFGDDFYIELQLNEVSEQKNHNAFLLEFAERLKIPVILGLDAHYAEEGDEFLLLIKQLISKGATHREWEEYQRDPVEAKRKIFANSLRELYIRRYEQWFDASKQLGYDYTTAQIEEWLENTNEISSKVDIDIPLYDIKYPKYEPPQNMTVEQYFKRLCREGFESLYFRERIPKNRIEEYKKHLINEINVIVAKGFASYFLIIVDILQEVRRMGGRVGAGRGSVVGSLVAYCLGITNLDPIKHELYFERFINESRKDPVDIDVDISSDEQKEIETFLKKKYGDRSVAHVANYSKFGAKTVLRDISRVMGWPLAITNTVAKLFDDDTSLEDNIRALQSRKTTTQVSDFLKSRSSDLLRWGRKLEGQVRHSGAHASGTVIAPGVLYDYIPIMKAKNTIFTAFQEGTDIREVSEIGLIKLDLLGLNTCSIIKDTLANIKYYTGMDVTDKLEMDSLEDKNVYDRFAIADTLDIFQFASEGMRKILVEATPENMTELATINALYRPATIKSGVVSQYIKNKKDPGRIQYIHPKLEPILGRTFGVIAFQEQVMRIFTDVGGFTLAEADNTRQQMKLVYKTIDKARKREWEATIEKFREGCRKEGMDDKTIDNLINKIVSYSSYAFNAAHSFGYALNAYQQMWLKVYYPREYYVSLLNRSNKEDLFTNIAEARNNGVNVEPLNLETSGMGFEIRGKSILCGFKVVKGITEQDVDRLIIRRPYADITDFFTAVFDEEAPISKRTVEPLICLGLLDKFDPNRRSVLDYYAKRKAKKKKQQFVAYESSGIEDFSIAEKMAFENQYMGFYWKHPITEYKTYLEKFDIPTPKAFSRGQMLGGVVTSAKVKKSKRGSNYTVFEVEDDSKKVSIKVWEEVPFKEGDVLMFNNVVSDDYGHSVRSKSQVMDLKKELQKST